MKPVEAKAIFSKFKDLPFRPLQDSAVEFALNSSKKFTILEAPTGSGKSLAGMCILAGKGSGIYAVHSKPLQNQIKDDFPEATVLFGRSNYPCLRDATKTHAECKSTKQAPCSLMSKCPYKVQKRMAISSSFPVLNYSYFLTEANYVGKFADRPVVVIDEADSLERTLYDFTSLSLHSKTLERYDIKIPGYKTVSTDNGLSNWRAWGAETHAELRKELLRLIRIEEHYSGDDDGLSKLQTQIERLEGLVRRLHIFNTHVDSTWLLDTREDKYGTRYEFKPLWLNPILTEEYLWKHSPKFVLMSATFPPVEVLAKILGLSYNQIDVVSIPSTFDPERRKVIVRPVANLTAKTMQEEAPKAIDAVRGILKSNNNVKGLIHTVSYKLRDMIMEIGNNRLITHNSKDKIEVLDYFKASSEPLVLVSPSSERGISLPDEDCRFIIILKAPFLNLGDKSVKLRIYSSQVGQLWYASDCALSIVQATGRGMRSAEDYCKTYVLDAQIYRLLTTKPTLFSSWWREAVEI